jgi:hypothetical protein
VKGRGRKAELSKVVVDDNDVAVMQCSTFIM